MTRAARSILVVDDNPDDLEIARCLLHEIDPGLEFRCAASGTEALAALEAAPDLPELVLVDLKMPGMEGTEVVRCLRRNARLRHLPAVLISHSRLESDRTRCLAAGADDVLHKDFDLGRMALAFRGLLERWPRP